MAGCYDTHAIILDLHLPHRLTRCYRRISPLELARGRRRCEFRCSFSLFLHFFLLFTRTFQSLFGRKPLQFQGEFNFEGDRDLGKFLETAQKVGLLVVLVSTWPPFSLYEIHQL